VSPFQMTKVGTPAGKRNNEERETIGFTEGTQKGSGVVRNFS